MSPYEEAKAQLEFVRGCRRMTWLLELGSMGHGRLRVHIHWGREDA